MERYPHDCPVQRIQLPFWYYMSRSM